MTDAEQAFNRGVQAFKSGDMDVAIESLEAATHMDHQNYRAFNHLGAAYAAKVASTRRSALSRLPSK